MTPTEKKLNRMLQAVSESGPQEAPSHVEQALRSAFRRRHSRHSAMRVIGISGAAVAIAASVAGIALLRPVAPVVSPLPVSTQALVRPLAVSPVAVAKRQPPPQARPRRRAVQPTLAKSAPQDSAGFFALPDADITTPLDHATIVRVQLPLSAFREIGLPVDEQSAGRPVRADVLLGQDGSARAVRFVRSDFVQ